MADHRTPARPRTGWSRLAAASAALNAWGIRAERAARRTNGSTIRRRRAAELAGAPGCWAPRCAVHWHEGGAGQPLLLLNGFAASGLVWPGSWVRDLKQRFRVIRIDNRGTGWSRNAPAPFTIADLADDAAAVLDAIGVEKAVILGFSMGGVIAQELAVRHPDRIARLILVSTIPPAPAHVPTDLRVLMPPPARIPVGSRSQSELLARFYLGTSARAFHPEPEVVDELAAQLHARQTPVISALQQWRASIAWRGPGRLAAITAPTTIVTGAADPIVRARNGDTLARLIPGARCVEFTDVGHLVPWEAPETLSRLLE
ncbi:alpha/beta fold hydrolase [Skermania sp. ID1734]|uniref:alpha/beta fold hydrolase n=1 Tax=Skermania sp. ID1734 TaxID=2597516 RepID=UPI00163D4E4A|nr:alpha/beta hydrolase [Skermania sp. ID1734]